MLLQGGVLLYLLVVEDVVVTDEVVAFFSGGLGSFSISELLIGKHRFTDVHSAVVDQVHFTDIRSIGFEDRRDRLADRVVAKVTEVQWFVCIWAAKLEHHSLVS